MRKLVSVVFIGLLLISQSTVAQSVTTYTSRELASRTVYRRAVDAVIWGAPAVTMDMMRQAYFRDAKASYNDIIWWPNGAGWQNQSLDVDTSVRYLYIFSNTLDFWQVPLTDVGVDGKGGKYLILPPGFNGDAPAGYIPLRPKTYGSYILIRSILVRAR